MVFSPKFEELAASVEGMPEGDWCGMFQTVHNILVTCCLLLRAARSGEPLSITSEDLANVITFKLYCLDLIAE